MAKIIGFFNATRQIREVSFPFTIFMLCFYIFYFFFLTKQNVPSSIPGSSSSCDINENEPQPHNGIIKIEECDMDVNDLNSKEGILPDQPETNYDNHTQDALSEDGGDTLTDDSGFYDMPRSPSHKMQVTTDVPDSYVYWFRGVDCPLCLCFFRGENCVSELEEHFRSDHTSEATTRAMKKLKEDTTPEKIMGVGMMYCGCTTCYQDSIRQGYQG